MRVTINIYKNGMANQVLTRLATIGGHVCATNGQNVEINA